MEVLIHGGASGADFLCAQWAKGNGVEVLPFPISKEDWAQYGNGAGPRRNAQMLREGKPDRCVAFPTPKSRGTWDMVTQCLNARPPVPVTIHKNW